MSRIQGKWKVGAIAALAVLIGATVWITQAVLPLNAAENEAPSAKPAATATPVPSKVPVASTEPSTKAAPAAQKTELPEEASFRTATENDMLRLKVDPTSAHFLVEDKRSGQIWRSYPNPEQWPKETITGTWRNNLRSPIMLEYIDAANFKSQSRITSWLEDKGILEQFQITSDGFKVTFNFVGTGFKVPVEVKLAKDYVETKIIDNGIQEGKLSLLNIKLYPSFGAEPSIGQEGYTFIPDGPGALIRFKENRSNNKSLYKESVYGSDISFFNEETSRQPVRMPVFGLKSGQQAFVAVITGGAEYAKLFASPAGVFGQSNWVTTEWQYRIKFFQNTSKKGNAGFFTYSKERFVVPERSVRYYLLEGSKSDYTGMALKYKEYLVKEKGLSPIKSEKSQIPFFVDIIGADVKQGLLWDKYLKGTTTSQAMEMVKRLYGLGIENMAVQYSGWQKGGASSYGDLLPVDSRLGGNEGMKQFIQYAHSLSIPVNLTANYSINNTGGKGFKPRYDGARNLAGRLLEFPNFSNGDMLTLMSPKYAMNVISDDLKTYKSLGADGIYFDDGIGRFLNTDFNDRYLATRSEVMQLHQDIVKETKNVLGNVSLEKSNFYTLGNVTHMHRLPDDYSYDLFVDEAVPFMQIALHGLVSYTTDWSNLRDEYRGEFLRAIEYGAYPAFVFTYAESGKMKDAYSIWYYSLGYRDWESKAVEEYQRFNEALADVQNKSIIGHRTVAPNVKETEYEGGKKVMVNYNAAPYRDGSIQIPAQDFIVIPGGKAS